MTRTARSRGIFAPLYERYAYDVAIMRAGDHAELLFLRANAFLSGALTDGYIPAEQLPLLDPGRRWPLEPARRPDGTSLPERVAALVREGLWQEAEGGYRVRSWVKWNLSAAEIREAKAKDAERKRAGVRPDGGGSPRGGGADSERSRSGVPHQNQNYNQNQIQNHPEPGVLALVKGEEQPRETPPADDLDRLAAALRARRPEWSDRGVRQTAQLCLDKSGSWPRAAAALLAIARDPQTLVPKRAVSDGWWWRDLGPDWTGTVDALITEFENDTDTPAIPTKETS